MISPLVVTPCRHTLVVTPCCNPCSWVSAGTSDRTLQERKIVTPHCNLLWPRLMRYSAASVQPALPPHASTSHTCVPSQGRMSTQPGCSRGSNPQCTQKRSCANNFCSTPAPITSCSEFVRMLASASCSARRQAFVLEDWRRVFKHKLTPGNV